MAITELSDSDSIFCVKVEMKNNSDADISLASQNYRLFYDAKSLRLIKTRDRLLLPDNFFTYNLVQHTEDVDASGVGSLLFEKNLGFINATVILNDSNGGGLPINKKGGTQDVLQLCFEPIDSGRSVILARNPLTASYGRAFVEVGQLDKAGKISTVPIEQYHDFPR